MGFLKKIIFLLLINSSGLFAQTNLVLNPSFEDNFLPIYCGTNLSPLAPFPFTNWSLGSLGSIDPFSLSVNETCLNHSLNIGLGAQSPRTGNNYVGYVNYHYTDFLYREYIRGSLSEALQVGVKYHVEFYVCLANFSSVGTNNIGISFINNTTPIFQTESVLPLIPDVNYNGSPIIDKDIWQLLSFEFIPTTSGLDAFIIGNFFDDNQTTIQVLDPGLLLKSYVLVEDVSVIADYPIFNLPDEICVGTDFEFPVVSENGYEGTWSPVFNNQETTTYYFTLINSESSIFEHTLSVIPQTIPEFDVYETFCNVASILSLPTISNNGIEGTWRPDFNPNESQTYIFTPLDIDCNLVTSINIEIVNSPIFSPIEPFCEYDLNFSLPTVSLNGISGTWTPEFDPYNSQTYTFNSTEKICDTDVTLDVVVYPKPNFDLNDFCYNGDYFVEVTSSINLSLIENIQWKINGTFISDESLIIKLSDYVYLLQDSNQIELTITDLNGCIHSKEILVKGDYLCNIQFGISPNGDGKNDYFDLASFGGVDLKVFNRYGSVVYKKQNYRNEWHGKSNSGKELPSGTYFYQIITIRGEVFTGWIQLVN